MAGIGQFLLSNLGAIVAVGSALRGPTIRLRLPSVGEKYAEGE